MGVPEIFAPSQLLAMRIQPEYLPLGLGHKIQILILWGRIMKEVSLWACLQIMVVLHFQPPMYSVNPPVLTGGLTSPKTKLAGLGKSC